MSYRDTRWVGESYSSAEMQSVYSTAQADYLIDVRESRSLFVYIYMFFFSKLLFLLDFIYLFFINSFFLFLFIYSLFYFSIFAHGSVK